MQIGNWCHSDDNIIYEGNFSTQDEAFSAALDCGHRYVGQYTEGHPEDYIDAAEIISDIQERFSDDYAYNTSMFNCSVEQGEELNKAFKEVFRDWINKHFGTVIVVENIIEPEEDPGEEAYREHTCPY